MATRVPMSMAPAELSGLDAHDVGVPTLATTLVEILSLRTDSDDHLDHLSELARLDPSLAIRVLALANSSPHAPVDPILDVESAAFRLGTRIAKEMVRSLSVVRVFVPTTRSHVMIWSHAVQVAVLARDLGAMLNRSISPKFLYTAGLLHDIGRLFMFAADPKGLFAVDEKNWRSPGELVVAEEQVFGVSHAELGACAATRCGLPDRLVEVIAKHHDRDDAIPADGQGPSVLSLIRQADLWSCRLLHEPDLEGPRASAMLVASALPEIEALLPRCDLATLVETARAITRLQLQALRLEGIGG